MSKTIRKTDRVLGVAVTSRTVHAILLENGPDGPEVVRRFSRQRAVPTTGFEEPVGGAVGQPAVHKNESLGGGDDFTIEFGSNNAAANNLFLSSEFGGLEEDGEEDEASAQAVGFDFELGDILSECSDSGYDDAALAFTLGSGDVSFVDITYAGGKQRPGRDTLLEILTAQHRAAFDDARVAFIPMTELEEDEQRYLAIIPKKLDSVSSTLTALREGSDLLPRVSLVDAEVTALLGLARTAKDAFSFHDEESGHHVLLFDEDGEEPDEDEAGESRRDSVHTLVVRAGAEDTLVLFMVDDELRHCELMRSLTAFDGSETICSRVLLQQDEHGIGDIHHVLVLSEERERDLTDAFEVFFPDAKVEPLRTYLPEIETSEEEAATAIVSAMAAALRVLGSSSYADAFEDVNFLPRKLARRKVKMPVQWHVVAMSVMIVITTIFFMTRYSSAESELAQYRERVENVAPDEVNKDITQLQAQIDSMQTLYSTYTRAINVLDTLLIGSDRWSRILENASREATYVRGLWIESFEQSGASIKISGNATSRDQVVEFADRMKGTIESLVFSEIREWPVYTYAMQIPVSDSLPEAAQYLRERVKLEEEAAAAANHQTRSAESRNEAKS